jgi:hypothetical protein
MIRATRTDESRIQVWRRAVALAVASVVFAGVGGWAAAAPIPPNVKLYVSPAGNDAWSGGLPERAADGTDGPLASLAGARDRIRQLRAAKKVPLPVDVLFRAGRYRLAETVEFGPEDSGTDQTPVTFRPYFDEAVEICGGETIKGWTVKDGVWSVTLPEVATGAWYFRTLFVNGQRAQRARTPDNPEHFFQIARILKDSPEEMKKSRLLRRSHQGFIYTEGDLENWPRLAEAAVFTYEAWARGIRKVQSIDPATRTVLFKRTSMWPAIHIGENRYWVENLPELLNAPGEWYLDRQNGRLSYIPRPGETPETCEVIAPRVATFVRLRADAAENERVEYLHFRDLTFRYGDWEMEENGYVAWQADVAVRGVIDLEGAHHVSISHCEVSRVGLYAINLARGSRHVRIFHNQLFDLGGGGVKIGHNYAGHYTYAFQEHPDGPQAGIRLNSPLPPKQRCGYNLVENNFIHHGGIIFASGIGVCVGRASWNRVAHNEISDFPYSGVSIGMNWDAGPTQAHDNWIEYNHIHRIGRRRMSDLGGIYMLGNSPGTVVRGNHIHDVHHRLYGSTCLYGDQGSSRILVEDNLFHHAGGTLSNGGFGQMEMRNNIFALAGGATFWQLDGISLMRRNLIFSSGEPLCVKWAEPGGAGENYDRNLRWEKGGGAPRWQDGSFVDWAKENGREAQSLVADPGFADPENGDFSLPEDSPARRLGFRPLDLSRVGLYGEQEWTSLPGTITPLPMASVAAVPIREIRYDFEDHAVGDTPEGFIIHAASDQGGEVAVSAEAPFAGKRCLTIRDSPEIKQDWNPHIYRQLGFDTGSMEMSFALRVDKLACPTIELRDYANAAPFCSGPSLAIGKDRELSANGKALGFRVPVGAWVQYRVVCRLGQGWNGTYDLSVTLPEGKVRTFPGLSYGRNNFRIATWLGLVSSGIHAGEFQMDSVSCRSLENGK